MKICTYCKIEKSLKYFAKHKNRKDGHSTACTKCMREYSKTHHQKNKRKHNKQIDDARTVRRTERYKWLLEYLKTHPCVDCGETDPIVLEFDHVDPKSKSCSISELLRGMAVDRFEAELVKCVVRCANCHRRKTMNETNTIRARLWREESSKDTGDRC